MRLQLRERLLQVVPSSIPKGAASLRSLVRALAASPLRDIQTRFHGQGKRPAQAHAAAAAAIEADAPRGLPADLDYHPRLSWAQEAQCFLLTSVFGCIIYLLTRPRAFSPLYVAAMAALLAGVLLVARLLLLEDKYVARQKEGPDLGDPESIFLQVDGIQVRRCWRS